MQPNYDILLEKAGITHPLIGFYDAPDPSAFEPIRRPKQEKWACVFMFYKKWLEGHTLMIEKENFGCGGAGYWLCNVETRKRDEFVKFLVDDEGLKSNHDQMNRWLDFRKPYKAQHPYLFIGALKEDQYNYLKTVTFYANPDQLSLLMLGANYDSGPDNPPAVIAPFGPGCGQLVQFDDLNVPQAIIGSTDIAMRQYLSPEIMAFTVTKPLFEKLCNLDEKSFLYKPFWENLKKRRGISNS